MTPKEKLSAFFGILITIVLDSLLVCIVAITTYFIKVVIEYFYGVPINKIDNVALFYVYQISKYLLISTVFLYAVYDIFRQAIDSYKKISK